MSAERTAEIMIGDERHTLLLTTRATREIAGDEAAESLSVTVCVRST